MWGISYKGVRSDKPTGGHPEFSRGRKLSPLPGKVGQRDEVVSPEPKSQGCRVGLGSQRGHSLCWKCCLSEGWGRYPGSFLPLTFHPATGSQLAREPTCRGQSHKTQGQEGRAKTASESKQAQPQPRAEMNCPRPEPFRESAQSRCSLNIHG